MNMNMNIVLTTLCIAFVIAVFAYDGWSHAQRSDSSRAFGLVHGALAGIGLICINVIVGWTFGWLFS